MTSNESYTVTFLDEDGQAHHVKLNKDGADVRAAKLLQALRGVGLQSEIHVPPAAEPVVPDWLAAYPAKHHELLRRHGVGPADHPAARAYNAALIERAEAGLVGQQLADAADALFDELISEREPDYEDFDPDAFVDWKALYWEAMSARQDDEK